MDPSLAKEIPGQKKSVAKDLVDWILTDELVSDSIFSKRTAEFLMRWQRASAIRVDDVLDVLRKLSASKPPEVPQHVVDAARTILEKFDQLKRDADAKSAEGIDYRSLLPALIQREGIAAIDQVKAASDVAMRQVEAWFNSAQDRARQWFTMNTRVVTVICACIAAFGIQLDAFALLKHLSSDSELRARLFASAPSITAQAQEFKDEISPFGETAHRRAVARLTNDWPAAGKLSWSADVTSDAALQSAMWPQFTNLFTNQAEAVFYLYTNSIHTPNSADIKAMEERMAGIQTELGSAGIDLIPSPYPDLCHWIGPFPHFVGLLASAALLSLGAPFWFNSLKTLTNLRPALAQQVEKNPRAAGQQQS
jgi:hypothetical protein